MNRQAKLESALIDLASRSLEILVRAAERRQAHCSVLLVDARSKLVLALASVPPRN
jgi:hypothetical protein